MTRGIIHAVVKTQIVAGSGKMLAINIYSIKFIVEVVEE